MTKGEQQVIRNIITRLEDSNCGSAVGLHDGQTAIDQAVKLLRAEGYEVVSRTYLDTWMIPPLRMILPDGNGAGDSVKGRDVDLAISMSGR